MLRNKFFSAFAILALAAAGANAAGATDTSGTGTAAADKAAPTPKEPVRNISAAAREAVRAGLSNADALAKVKAEFPEANTTTASIAWYRNDLRKKGETFASPKKPVVEKAPKTPKAPKGTGPAETKATPQKAAGETAKAGEFE